MMNASPVDVVAKLQAAPYAKEFRAAFGASVFDNPDNACESILTALAKYQDENPEFDPFTSNYDYFLPGRADLSQQELGGLALYVAEDKGNCAACQRGNCNEDGSPPLFTDFTYDNFRGPGNSEIPATVDAFADRIGLSGRTDLCGAFKAPKLRNVAITVPYFNNGKLKTLKEGVAFYVRHTSEKPYDRTPGQARALNEQEIDDLIAFLATLTDGYQP